MSNCGSAKRSSSRRPEPSPLSSQTLTSSLTSAFPPINVVRPTEYAGSEPANSLLLYAITHRLDFENYLGTTRPHISLLPTEHCSWMEEELRQLGVPICRRKLLPQIFFVRPSCRSILADAAVLSVPISYGIRYKTQHERPYGTVSTLECASSVCLFESSNNGAVMAAFTVSSHNAVIQHMYKPTASETQVSQSLPSQHWQ